MRVQEDQRLRHDRKKNETYDWLRRNRTVVYIKALKTKW